MRVTFDIPDTVAAQLTAAGKDPARVALESFAIDGYHTQQLSEGQIRRMLGYGTRMQVHALLKEHGVPLHYSLEDFEQDLETSHSLRASARRYAK
ncbi:MAG TPA: UPF0175 family protein [Granulicella sp.]|jgi:predicted HTH domain antitoxin